MYIKSVCVIAVVFLACVSVALCEDPDTNRNVTQMIAARGYPFEQHNVVSSDGFILSVQRITGPRGSHGSPNASKPVVLLQHGLEDNSISWVIQEVVEQSLGFILADHGYDVWMSNARGNTYSNSHTHLKPSDSAFWAFSFDEMSHLDLPTLVNYVTATTHQKNISYVGHSQGTMMGFIGFEDKTLASKVNLFVALAPVAWVSHTSSKLLSAMADHINELEFLMKLFGMKEFLPDNEILEILLPNTCHLEPKSCEFWLELVMGFDPSDWNNTRLPVILAHEPSGTSVQNMIHWAQLVDKNTFQAMDFGTSGNMKHYNQPTPPIYDPEMVTVPTALFWGGNDDLADVADVEHLIPLLKNVVYQHYEPGYCHTDFIWGVDAAQKIYAPILELLKKYATNTKH